MSLTTETVATVLELELSPIIERWMKRVDKVPDLTSIALSYDDRIGYLPQLFEDLITRLRLKRDEHKPPTSSSPRPRQGAVPSGVLGLHACRKVTAIASQHL
jgi:hypothetical protein